MAERNRRWFVRVVTAAVIVTISILLLLITDRRRRGEQTAREDAQSALAREKVARKNEQAALTNEKIARGLAEGAQESEAQQRDLAEQQRDLAVRQRNLAYARFLIAEGERLIRGGQERRASLFFVTALQMADSPEARGSLLCPDTQESPPRYGRRIGSWRRFRIGIHPLGAGGRCGPQGRHLHRQFVSVPRAGVHLWWQQAGRDLATDGADRIVSLEYSDDEHELLGLGLSGRFYQGHVGEATAKLEISTRLRDIREAVEIEEAVPATPPYALSRQAIAAGSEGEGVTVFRIGRAPARVTEIARFSGNDCFGLALAIDNRGAWLACYVQEASRRSVRIWSLGPKRLVREIPIPNGFGFLSSIAMSGDGKYLSLGDQHEPGGTGKTNRNHPRSHSPMRSRNSEGGVFVQFLTSASARTGPWLPLSMGGAAIFGMSLPECNSPPCPTRRLLPP